MSPRNVVNRFESVFFFVTPSLPGTAELLRLWVSGDLTAMLGRLTAGEVPFDLLPPATLADLDNFCASSRDYTLLVRVSIKASLVRTFRGRIIIFRAHVIVRKMS